MEYADFYNALHRTLENIRLTQGIESAHEWREVLGYTQREYIKTYLNSKRIGPKAVIRVADRYDLEYESIIYGRIDFTALLKHTAGHEEYLPQRYEAAAFGKRRTMMNIFRTIDQIYGLPTRFQVMRSLQVKPAAFVDEDAKINLNFGVDIFERFFRNNPDFLLTLGAESIAKTVGLPFSKSLFISRNIPELYTNYLEVFVKDFDLNYTYRYVGVSDTEFLVEAIQNDEVVEGLKNKRYGSPEICQFKTGLIANIPAYLGLTALPIRKTACIHSGDQTCKWTVGFNGAKNFTQQHQDDVLSRILTSA